MRLARFAFLVSFAALASGPLFAKGVTEADLRGHVEILASDAFEGRKPGTAGETKTIKYIADAWAKAGLKPAAADGSWFDPVPLIQRGQGSSTYAFTAKGRTLRIVSDDIVLIGQKAAYTRSNLPLIFTGAGVTAKGQVAADVKGKAAFVLFGADNVPDNMKSPRARREALIAAGAEAVIFVGDSQGNWLTLRRQLLSRPITLQSREKRAPLEGAISTEFMVGLVTAAGQDWDKLRANAKQADYAGEALGIDADFDVKTDLYRFNSSNVIGKIAGRKKNSGAILFMGHWDHLGICAPEGAPDRICNGAVDNASGIAVMNEVAEALAKKKHYRDIYFLATTAEESGLLGAYAFADKPVLPLDQIIISLNIDTIAIAARGAKVAIIGRGTTPMDAVVEAVAKKTGRAIEGSTDANAFLQRQDGWALAQKGVPSLMVGGSFADLNLLQKFLGSDYHGPNDELADRTELGGAAEDTDLHIALGRHFADTRKYKSKKAGE
ncbi:M28 family peptidase [Sphingorhabdus sp. EL138]|uniref:M28 family peptidase n=1 Tax=Sphingorhabdus sp. EL138 TaxID=2073156 RepID=UPI0025E0EFBA|nr:M28 family peptidase [Sphingorhabdus sp. EL138]